MVMMRAELSVSVVICAYTEARWLELLAAVESVRRQTLSAREIILVIDHNPALLARARDQFQAGGILVVENRGVQGLSGARNSGIAVAQGEIIAFMDEDAVAAPDWLERLSAAYRRDTSVLGVGGLIEPLWLAGRPAWLPEEFQWVVGCSYRGLPEVHAPVRNLIGCNMSFRREIFEVVGGFRDGIGRIGTRPLGCEETELCIRVRQRWTDGVLLYEPEARVLHRVPASRGQVTYYTSRCYSEGLSKALVSRFVGSRDGLASERSYTFKTLPRGVLRGMADALRRDWGGLARAAMIVVGLVCTAAGYMVGRIRLWRFEPDHAGRSVGRERVYSETAP